MNAFVQRDAKTIKKLIEKPEYAYLSDDLVDASISRYLQNWFLKDKTEAGCFLGLQIL